MTLGCMYVDKLPWMTIVFIKGDKFEWNAIGCYK